MKKDSEEEVEFVNIPNKTQEKSDKGVESQSTKDYLKYFEGLMQTMNFDPTTYFSDSIVTFTKQIQIFQIQIKILSHSKNFEVVALGVSIGPFSMNINLININQCFQKRYSNMISGTFGEIYFEKYRGKNLVRKILLFKEQSNINHTLILAIRQIFFLKIASVLQSGPAISQGFDLAIYEDSVEFIMEQCQSLSQYFPSIMQIQQLKKSLLLNHMVHLIHYDIKPQNICYSPTFKKLVFIDYGLADYISSILGQKCQTKFRGSVNYCSQDMLNVYCGGRRYIDAYYNDMHSLDISISQIKNIIGKIDIQNSDDISCYESKKQNSKVVLSLMLRQAKFHMYRFDEYAFREILKQISPQNINYVYSQMIEFLAQLKPHQCLKNIYFEIKKYLPFIQQDYRYLQRIYCNQTDQLHFYYKITQIETYPFEKRYKDLLVYTNQPNFSHFENDNKKDELKIFLLQKKLFLRQKFENYHIILIEYLRLDSDLFNIAILEKEIIINQLTQWMQQSAQQKKVIISQSQKLENLFQYLLNLSKRSFCKQFNLSYFIIIFRQFFILGVITERKVGQMFQFIQNQDYLNFQKRLHFLFNIYLCVYWIEGQLCIHQSTFRSLKIYLMKQIYAFVLSYRPINQNQSLLRTLFYELVRSAEFGPFQFLLFSLCLIKFQIPQFTYSEIRYYEINCHPIFALGRIQIIKSIQKKQNQFYYYDFYIFEFLKTKYHTQAMLNICQKFERILKYNFIIQKYFLKISYQMAQISAQQIVSPQFLQKIYSFYLSSNNNDRYSFLSKIIDILGTKYYYEWIQINSNFQTFFNLLKQQQQKILFNQCKMMKNYHIFVTFKLWIFLNFHSDPKRQQLQQYLNKITSQIQSNSCQICKKKPKQFLILIEALGLSYINKQQSLQLCNSILSLQKIQYNDFIFAISIQLSLQLNLSYKSKAISAIYNFALQNNNFCFYYQFYTISSNIIQLTLIKFTSQNQFQNIFIFLMQLTNYLIYFSNVTYVHILIDNLSKYVTFLISNQITYRQKLCQELVEKIYQVRSYKNHYCCLVLIGILEIEISQQYLKKAMVIIAQNLMFLNLELRKLMQQKYYFYFLKYLSKQKRKNKKLKRLIIKDEINNPIKMKLKKYSKHKLNRKKMIQFQIKQDYSTFSGVQILNTLKYTKY